MERWDINRLAYGITDNAKRVRKIQKCKTHRERIDLAMRYAVACAKDEKIRATESDIVAVASAAIVEIERRV